MLTRNASEVFVYRTVATAVPLTGKQLTALGRQGWELVSVARTGPDEITSTLRRAGRPTVENR